MPSPDAANRGCLRPVPVMDGVVSPPPANAVFGLPFEFADQTLASNEHGTAWASAY